MFFYRLVSILILPLLLPYALLRILKGKEDKSRIKERFGFSSIARPQGQVIWLHAVSVGEANSSFVLIDEILKFSPKTTILLTTTTVTSAAIIKAKLAKYNGRLIHQFLPFDSYFCVKQFFKFWKLRAALFVESEIWPNMIFEARKHAVNSFLVNARLSKKSISLWSSARKIGFTIFDYFTAIFVQMKEDQDSLQQLTEQPILYYGNLKSEAQVLQVNQEELAKLKSQIGQRKFWIAASTHKGEEDIVMDVHNRLKKDFSDLLTIIVLRHPNRCDEVKNLLNGTKFSQRSKGEVISSDVEFYLADTLGELGTFYSLNNFAFIGGSLYDIGGHNPFEPIKLGCAVISGRGVRNFKEIYDKLASSQACLMVDSPDDLYAVVKQLLENSDLCQDLSAKANKLVESSDSAAKKIVQKLDHTLLLNL